MTLWISALMPLDQVAGGLDALAPGDASPHADQRVALDDRRRHPRLVDQLLAGRGQCSGATAGTARPGGDPADQLLDLIVGKLGAGCRLI
jgi:hypothetical protein